VKLSTSNKIVVENTRVGITNSEQRNKITISFFDFVILLIISNIPNSNIINSSPGKNIEKAVNKNVLKASKTFNELRNEGFVMKKSHSEKT